MWIVYKLLKYLYDTNNTTIIILFGSFMKKRKENEGYGKEKEKVKKEKKKGKTI